MTTPRAQPSAKAIQLHIKQALDKKKKISKKRHCTSNRQQVVSFDFDKPLRSYKPKVKKTRVSHEMDLKNSSPMDRALEIQANLTSKFPSFVKNMLPSHVSGGFWLGLPKNFTTRYLPSLPKREQTVVLVDETGLEYDTKYLAEKNGLSGGWRGFSIAHDLQARDVLIFHLIQKCKFKVYIVRASALTETDLAITLVNLGACAKEMVDDHQKENLKITVTGQEEQLDQYSHIHSVQEKDMVALSGYADSAEKHAGMDDSDDSAGIRFPQSVIDFKDVTTFENFYIIVYGYIVLDNEIPQHFRVKYYELCCSQKSYLHDQLADGLQLDLVVGVILETINIADGIRSFKLTSSENLKQWDNTLKAFEVLGMKVGFLRARINKLATLSSDAKDALNRKILEKVKAEEEFRALVLKKMKAEEEIRALVLKKVKAEEEMISLKTELVSVKKVIDNSDHKIEYMKRRSERLEAVILEESKAPW